MSDGQAPGADTRILRASVFESPTAEQVIKKQYAPLRVPPGYQMFNITPHFKSFWAEACVSQLQARNYLSSEKFFFWGGGVRDQNITDVSHKESSPLELYDMVNWRVWNERKLCRFVDPARDANAGSSVKEWFSHRGSEFNIQGQVYQGENK